MCTLKFRIDTNSIYVLGAVIRDRTRPGKHNGGGTKIRSELLKVARLAITTFLVELCLKIWYVHLTDILV